MGSFWSAQLQVGNRYSKEADHAPSKVDKKKPFRNGFSTLSNTKN